MCVVVGVPFSCNMVAVGESASFRDPKVSGTFVPTLGVCEFFSDSPTITFSTAWSFGKNRMDVHPFAWRRCLCADVSVTLNLGRGWLYELFFGWASSRSRARRDWWDMVRVLLRQASRTSHRFQFERRPCSCLVTGDIRLCNTNPNQGGMGCKGEKLVVRVPLIPSTSDVYQEIFDDVLEVLDDVLIQGSKPNSGLVIECKPKCGYFGGLCEGFISATNPFEPLDVIIGITETEKMGY